MVMGFSTKALSEEIPPGVRFRKRITYIVSFNVVIDKNKQTTAAIANTTKTDTLVLSQKLA